MSRRLGPFDVVRIPAGIAEQGVPPEARAVVVEVHEDPHLAYEIEVVDEDGMTLFIGAVDPAWVEVEAPE